jgi:pimeloyl-ACP methyl ester carboxylesterase
VPVAVPIIAGTAVRGIAAKLMMRNVLERHPNAFLITLAEFGVTLPLHRSQDHIHADITKQLRARGQEPDAPIVLVGHSQGGLAVLRYTADHPDQVLHVFSIGIPWHGARTAGRLSRVMKWTGRDFTPGLTDMAPNSPFLTRLHADLPAIADRVTNIFSTHEVFMQPYTAAYIDVPGVTNILIAPEEEYRSHLERYPQHPVDDVILRKTNHLGEMSAPELRGRIWAKVEEVSAHQP